MFEGYAKRQILCNKKENFEFCKERTDKGFLDLNYFVIIYSNVAYLYLYIAKLVIIII